MTSSIDQYLYDHDDFMVFVAAGNSGANNRRNSVGSPATSKNIISVGATESFGPDLSGSMKGTDYVAFFSSRGPTGDGRMKPDVMAPGK